MQAMADRRIYKKAPITEAVLVIAVSDLQDLEKLRPARDRLIGLYPSEQVRRELRAELRFGEAEGAVRSDGKEQKVAFLLKNEGSGKIVRLNRVDFAFSKLAPYTQWEEFCRDARQAWTVYKHVAQPAAIERLAMRYINRIDVPGHSINTEHYLRTGPVISPDLPQQLASFTLRLLLPADDIGGGIIVNTALVSPVVKDHMSLLLDIDVFVTQDVPQDESDIWAKFELLHKRKNEVFEASITDKARELFN
jgi:uncharacterized protein (TIGR04255 family)